MTLPKQKPLISKTACLIGRRQIRLILFGLILPLMGLYFWSGCRTVPVTGRRQVLIIPESQEIVMGNDTYRKIVADEPASTNKKYIEMVNRVGKRIAAIAGRDDYEWEFHVIASPKKNAFALPGGKVAVYEGILPLCENEAGLAVVMSHEIAHALSRHGGERMSQSAITKGVQRAIAQVTASRAEVDRKIVLAAFGAASEYGIILPYSRKHESEADHIGVILMAKAGYDPREAPRFWERFSSVTAAQAKQPEFLSTHPADERRASDLRALLPDALKLYQQAGEQFGLGISIGIGDKPADR